MDQYGHCADLTSENDCTAYCQVSTAWCYGREASFQGLSTCSAGGDCSITNTQTTSISSQFAFNIGGSLGTRSIQIPEGEDGMFLNQRLLDILATRDEKDAKVSTLEKIKAAFNIGATWSWSDTFSNATAGTSNKPDWLHDKAGYWTFVPYIVTSCGSLTVGEWDYDQDPKQSTCANAETIGNFCQDVPYTDSNGQPMGTTLFVTTTSDSDRTPAPFCWQDDIFLQPGVSTEDSVYADYVTAHEDFDINKEIESTATYMCQHEIGQYKLPGNSDAPQPFYTEAPGNPS